MCNRSKVLVDHANDGAASMVCHVQEPPAEYAKARLGSCETSSGRVGFPCPIRNDDPKVRRFCNQRHGDSHVWQSEHRAIGRSANPTFLERWKGLPNKSKHGKALVRIDLQAVSTKHPHQEGQVMHGTKSISW